MPKTISIHKKTKRIIILFVLLLLFIIYQNNLIALSRFKFEEASSLKTNSKIKILQISDMHNKNFFYNQKYLINKIKVEAPDMILITGDLIDHKSRDLKAVEKLLMGISDVSEIYYVNGNHEAHSSEYESLLECLKNYGVSVLSDEKVEINLKGLSVNVIGLQDPQFEGVLSQLGDLEEQFGLKESEFNILLSHRPEYFSYYASHDIDFVFSGHAHGGQFRIPFLNQGLFAPNQGLFPNYTKGSYHSNKTSMFVSAGLGNSIIPFRLFNRPELIIVEIYK